MSKHADDVTLLPEDYVPGKMDVICSWARQNQQHGELEV
jgi:hypothetical protein